MFDHRYVAFTLQDNEFNVKLISIHLLFIIIFILLTYFLL